MSKLNYYLELSPVNDRNKIEMLLEDFHIEAVLDCPIGKPDQVHVRVMVDGKLVGKEVTCPIIISFPEDEMFTLRQITATELDPQKMQMLINNRMTELVFGYETEKDFQSGVVLINLDGILLQSRTFNLDIEPIWWEDLEINKDTICKYKSNTKRELKKLKEKEVLEYECVPTPEE